MRACPFSMQQCGTRPEDVLINQRTACLQSMWRAAVRQQQSKNIEAGYTMLRWPASRACGGEVQLIRAMSLQSHFTVRIVLHACRFSHLLIISTRFLLDFSSREEDSFSKERQHLRMAVSLGCKQGACSYITFVQRDVPACLLPFTFARAGARHLLSLLLFLGMQTALLRDTQ